MKTPKPVATYDVSHAIKIVRFSHNQGESLSLEAVLRRISALNYRVPTKAEVVEALERNPAIAENHMPVVLVTRGNNGSKVPSRKAAKSRRGHQHITTALTILSDNGKSQQNTGSYQHMPGTTNFVVKA